MAQACPHRGASLFFGRNEEAGLRCVYHGWKFDVAGRCVDMPNEPAESDFKTKVRAVAYPCQERGGIVWAYMGPRQDPPPLPDLEANMLEGATATAWSKGQTADVHFQDGVIDIILGRRQMSEYDDLVNAWRNEAGETVRKEFMDSMAAAKA